MARAVADLDKTVKDSAQNYATKDMTDDHETRITKLETKNIIKDTLLWVGLVASAIINIILYITFFSGRKNNVIQLRYFPQSS